MNTNKLKNTWLKKYGYVPTNSEIIKKYYQGELQLTDAQENEILKIISKNE